MNTYLIAYIAPSGRIMTRKIMEDSQQNAIREIKKFIGDWEIIAITLLEN